MNKAEKVLAITNALALSAPMDIDIPKEKMKPIGSRKNRKAIKSSRKANKNRRRK